MAAAGYLGLSLRRGTFTRKIIYWTESNVVCWGAVYAVLRRKAQAWRAAFFGLSFDTFPHRV
jgi:hypothetical protein